ncbi:MAG: RHS repeat protein [Candidatus Eremiobacteraeota bacterium]|nr:RHS repeat protein [Candidatus Eremiobacteraeota bacterium]
MPGIGSAGVNVANGNLILRSRDMVIAHKGVPFVFDRTYNSQSRHDAAGSDGSQPSVFGNGWTNNYDAHIASNDLGGISVYSGDGARYDFTPTTSPNYPTGWMPPAGVFDQLSVNTDGTYDLTDTGGKILRFYPPSGSGCPSTSVCGRLQFEIGRNHYTSLRFTYSFSSPSYSLASMTQISVEAEDGEVVQLNLAPTANGPLLMQLVWPGGQSVTYGYDSLGNLNAADEVDNNNAWIPQSYGYSGTQLSYVTDPRFSSNPTHQACAEGGYEQFNYDSSNRISAIQAFGVVNFQPSDGTGTFLQPSAAQGCVQYLQMNWGFSGGTNTSFSDSDGHVSSFVNDALGRVTSATPLGGAGTAAISATWNANNEVTAETDVNGQTSHFAYDSNGNRTAISEPTTPTSTGAINPTYLQSFDSNSNLIASCDPNWNAAHGQSWSGSGLPASCAPQSGVPYATWASTSYEPYGELTAVYTARGYRRVVSYNSYNQSGGDFGLPTGIVGDPITQADSSVITPTESFTYDAHGNQTAYNFGPGAWYFTYDSTNRILTTRDPDGFLAYTNWFDNGDLESTESSYQYALERKSPGSGAVQYRYDPDRNATSATHHYGGIAGTSAYWYDGASRLVEAAQPLDKNDQVQAPFMARYLYDNSQGGAVSIVSPTNNVQRLAAHGNFYATQFYLPSSAFPQSAGWQFFSGYASDGADRPVANYTLQPGRGSSGLGELRRGPTEAVLQVSAC